ncbi:hypothetical protein B0H14DRAFT_3643286 [Mycena olivaceomarginata]|nr:hypothetical protein B0H14DRAFT_3643286 [Mycena olivaceomarginata]
MALDSERYSRLSGSSSPVYPSFGPLRDGTWARPCPPPFHNDAFLQPRSSSSARRNVVVHCTLSIFRVPRRPSARNFDITYLVGRVILIPIYILRGVQRMRSGTTEWQGRRRRANYIVLGPSRSGWVRARARPCVHPARVRVVGAGEKIPCGSWNGWLGTLVRSTPCGSPFLCGFRYSTPPSLLTLLHFLCYSDVPSGLAFVLSSAAPHLTPASLCFPSPVVALS